MKKIFAILTVIAAFGVVLSGCNKPAEGDTAGGTSPSPSAPAEKK